MIDNVQLRGLGIAVQAIVLIVFGLAAMRRGLRAEQAAHRPDISWPIPGRYLTGATLFITGFILIFPVLVRFGYDINLTGDRQVALAWLGAVMSIWTFARWWRRGLVD